MQQHLGYLALQEIGQSMESPIKPYLVLSFTRADRIKKSCRGSSTAHAILCHTISGNRCSRNHRRTRARHNRHRSRRNHSHPVTEDPRE